jgi:signal peptidase II
MTSTASAANTTEAKVVNDARDRRLRWLVFFGLAAVVIVADQLSKMWIDANFAVASPTALSGTAQPTSIIDGFVRIAKSYNDGGIFGLFGNSAIVLALASTVVIALIVVYQWREGTSGTWLLTIALGLLLGGALGNFIDRIRYEHVIDFVDMGIGDWRWYTFNVADAAISIALVLLIAVSLFGDRLDRFTRRPSHEAS